MNDLPSPTSVYSDDVLGDVIDSYAEEPTTNETDGMFLVLLYLTYVQCWSLEQEL